MIIYVLDTDHLTLLRNGNPEVGARVSATPAADVAVTVISIEEQLRGWFTQVRKARDTAKLARAYRGLYDVIEKSKTLQILPFTRTAIDRYKDLRKQLPRLGKNDLAIAAIVLESNATLVTRNSQDFAQIPGLQMEDWSAPTP